MRIDGILTFDLNWPKLEDCSIFLGPRADKHDYQASDLCEVLKSSLEYTIRALLEVEARNDVTTDA